MNYEKLNRTRFSENLNSGKYANLTGARRAIGKASWTDKEKESARHEAEKFFGGATPTAASSTPKKASAAKAAKTAKPKTVTKAATPKVAKAAAKKPAKIPGRKPGRPAKAVQAQPLVVQETKNFEEVELGTCERMITISSAAIEAMKNAKTVDNKIVLSELQTAVDVMNDAMTRIGEITSALISKPQKQEPVAAVQESTEPANGHVEGENSSIFGRPAASFS